MTSLQMYFAVVFAFVALFCLYLFIKRQRYKAAINRPFPDDWKKILERRLPIYKNLQEDQRESLQRLIIRFLHSKRFVGCAGQEITDEVRVVIAAEACLLILGRPSTQYKDLRWIYVYPTTFIAKQDVQNEYGVVSRGGQHLLGVSWSNGRIVLAWDSVERGIDDFADGQNVVLHEFAHQLDQEDGTADGAPLLYTKDAYGVWAKVLSREFEALVKASINGEQTLIDDYGATNPAEFFAVVTELYFEKPRALRDQHPQLFEVFKNYYKNDPSLWKPHD